MKIFFIFFLSFPLVSCSTSVLKQHFSKSRTGWSKSEVLKKFGPPFKSYEDSSYSYYVYSGTEKPKSSRQKPRDWLIKYTFQNNELINIEKEKVPTSEEIDQIKKDAELKKEALKLKKL